MKRPMLVSGLTLTGTLLLLLLSGGKAAPVLCAAAALVFLLSRIKKIGLRFYIFLPFACCCVILATLCFLGNEHLTKRTAAAVTGNEISFSGKITAEESVNESFRTYRVRTQRISNTKQHITLLYRVPKETEYALFDCISVHGASVTRAEAVSAYPAQGIRFLAESDAPGVVLGQDAHTLPYFLLNTKELCVRQALRYLSPEEASLFTGMLFGGSDRLSDQTLSDFRESGVAHLLAVSGLHTALWCGILLALFNFLGLPEKARNLLLMLFLAGFCILTGMTPSVLRASLMLLLVLASPFFRRQPDSLNSVGFAMTVIVLVNPYAAGSPSFLLSVSATFGVLAALALTKRCYQKTKNISVQLLRRTANYLLGSALVSGMATLFTLPFSAYFFGTVSTLSILTNLLAIKPAFWALLSGTLCVLLSFVPFGFCGELAKLCARLTEMLLHLTEAITHGIAAIPFSCVTVNFRHVLAAFILLAAVAGTGFAVFRIKKRKSALKLCAVTSALLFFCSLSVSLLPIRSSTELRVHDVGDGLCISLRSGTHYLLLPVSGNAGKLQRSIYEAVPAHSGAQLDALLLPSVSRGTGQVLQAAASRLQPENIWMTRYVYDTLCAEDSVLPRAVIREGVGFPVSDKIHTEFIDTYGTSCVIIEGYGKRILISLWESNDPDDLIRAVGAPDVLVVRGSLPACFTGFCDTVIVSSDTGLLRSPANRTAPLHCNHYRRTCLEGTVTIQF